LRILVIAVGRLRAGPELELYRHYAARLNWAVAVKEIAAAAGGTAAVARARDGAALLAALPPGARAVALDAGGELLTSEGLAARLGGWRDSGLDTLAFLIGGAEGLDDKLRARADLLLAFGRVTWPHLLMRGMLAEQLYRAQQILAGHPYHRGS
jgi:23S rRNA (pseudouridine1915-N3)-methyltransferase